MDEKKNSPDYVAVSGIVPILETLTSLFRKAITKAFPNLVDPPVVVDQASTQSLGDYQCNSAMALSQLLKAQNVKLAPRDIAAKIVECLPPSGLICSVDIGGPGFINIYVERTYLIQVVQSVLKDGVKPPPAKKQRVVVDFSSPNIAKEMHVGHLRSTIIGESICRVLEFHGHSVLRLNHVGDWGTQFGMLIAHLQDKFPNFKNESPPISDLQAFYKESKARFDTDEAFKKRAYADVVKLQAGEKDHIKAWQLICDVSRQEFQKVYDRLKIKLEERGESFYQQRMIDIVKLLESKGLIEPDEGRKIMWGAKANDSIPLTVVKSDGGFTYDTSDMATIRNRIEEEKGDWLIYVTDSGQSVHFKVIFSCAERAGILDRSRVRVDHVPFGVVLGEDKKKFKTRSGDTVKLVDLLDEGLKRSLDKLCEKERDKVLTPDELKRAQEAVAYGCIKYADLCHNRTNEYIFSFDKMLDDRGNTAVYMLYAYTRIKSIARNCGGDYADNIKKVAEHTRIELGHDREMKLAKVIAKFPDVMMAVTRDLCLHYLCEYVYTLSTTFSEFYDSCYCIEKNRNGDIVKINDDRILLCEATAMVLGKSLNLLGLELIEKI
jgi:arginyl-tRNA synthetase